MANKSAVLRPARRLRPALPTFAVAALRTPMTTGAIAPSSPRLARVLASVVPYGANQTVLELGPGTGTVSDAISVRCPQHTAVEINEQLVAHMRRTRPHVQTLHADVLDLRGAVGLPSGSVDAVVSGLPWSLFSAAAQRRILDDIRALLTPEGVFSTFAYTHARRLPGASSFRAALSHRFGEVATSATVWRNVPPAGVYFCRRPILRRPATDR